MGGIQNKGKNINCSKNNLPEHRTAIFEAHKFIFNYTSSTRDFFIYASG